MYTCMCVSVFVCLSTLCLYTPCLYNFVHDVDVLVHYLLAGLCGTKKKKKLVGTRRLGGSGGGEVRGRVLAMGTSRDEEIDRRGVELKRGKGQRPFFQLLVAPFPLPTSFSS